jgi:hypothetical protein
LGGKEVEERWLRLLAERTKTNEQRDQELELRFAKVLLDELNRQNIEYNTCHVIKLAEQRVAEWKRLNDPIGEAEKAAVKTSIEEMKKELAGLMVNLVNRALRDTDGHKRKIWAPPVPFAQEIEKLSGYDFGRLWASRWNQGVPTEFSLRAGRQGAHTNLCSVWRRGTKRDGSEDWWVNTTNSKGHEEPILRCLIELAKDPESTLRRGGQVSHMCCRCSKTLTDPLSMSLGIGPECRSK